MTHTPLEQGQQGIETLPSDTTHHAVRVRVEVMERLGYDASAFDRNKFGNFYRGWRLARRKEIWRAMRANPLKPSYPEIAWACGMESHTSILDACAEKPEKPRRRGKSGGR